MNVIARLEYELAYYDSAVHRFNHYTTRTPPYDMGQGEGPIVPLTVMHRKRVTFELHDSYFRLMTIKHSISKIQWAFVWALNYYLTQLSSGCQRSCQKNSRQLETRCGRESHNRPRGPSETPDGVDPNIRRTRHNVTVITVGSKYEVYVRSPAPSNMQTLNNPFEPLQ